VIGCLGAESHVYHISYEHIKDICNFDLSVLNNELSKVKWRTVGGKDGFSRASAWFTSNKCSCPYVYSGQAWPAMPFEDWMTSLAIILKDGLGLHGIPDAVNLNRYINKKCSLGFHADDEHIFKQDDGCRTIVSLSVGASRPFWLKKHYDDESNALEVILKSGDICVMQGKTQSFWQHKIPRDMTPTGAHDDQCRYNLTFRFITRHSPKCQTWQVGGGSGDAAKTN
jgi:alkylated DNA repair dioxygenase AlkB